VLAVAESTSFDPADYDLSTDRPLRTGAGQIDAFHGKIRDVRAYARALDANEMGQLCAQPPD
jgi:hypothetical protein